MIAGGVDSRKKLSQRFTMSCYVSVVVSRLIHQPAQPAVATIAAVRSAWLAMLANGIKFRLNIRRSYSVEFNSVYLIPFKQLHDKIQTRIRT